MLALREIEKRAIFLAWHQSDHDGVAGLAPHIGDSQWVEM
jgi:hypothetical protein